MSFIAKILKAIGNLGSGSSVGCWKLWIDEPEMPKSMIEK
jgi:cyclic lactone autoinducer peptide